MKPAFLFATLTLTGLTMCAKRTGSDTGKRGRKPARGVAQAPKAAPPDPATRDTDAARKLVEAHTRKFAALEKKANEAWWKASITGSAEAYARRSELEIRLRKLHSDPKVFKRIKTKGAPQLMTAGLGELRLCFAVEVVEATLQIFDLRDRHLSRPLKTQELP